RRTASIDYTPGIGMRYVALLRGINVGGNRIIKMADLQRIFEELGCGGVSTYIQSGNVIFENRIKDTKKLAAAIEQATGAPVFIFSAEQLDRVVSQCPAAFGSDPSYKCDVVFVMPPFEARAILPTISLRAGVDEAFEGNGVLYFRKLISAATKSHM